MSDLDVIVIGAGAAGLAAARTAVDHGLRVQVVEARDRVGGRAHTLSPQPDLALDLGCGWLHSADRNDWVRVAEDLGFEIDRSKPAWTRPALNFPSEEQALYRRAFADFEERLEAAARSGRDAPASSLFTPNDARWRPLLDAFSGYYNGAPFEEISIQDYAAYQPTDLNWRVQAGYGALIAAFARNLPITLSCPATSIQLHAARVCVDTVRGQLEARAAIVCVPTAVLAAGAIVFDPPADEILEASLQLPLGHVLKAFLRLPPQFQIDPDTRVQARTDTVDTAGYTLAPMGMPVVEAYFGGRLAAQLEEAGSAAVFDFAREELRSALGARFADQLAPLACSDWSRDPFSRGAYSHALPGHADKRAVLAAGLAPHVVFAGEACSPHAFSTAHGAFETGVRAATRAAEALGARPSHQPSA